MTTIINLMKTKPWPEDFVYIGRANKYLKLPGSKWSNPYHLKREADRPTVLALYREYIMNSPNLLLCLNELDDKVLGCYCFPKACHGGVLIELRELQKKGLL